MVCGLRKSKNFEIGGDVLRDVLDFDMKTTPTVAAQRIFWNFAEFATAKEAKETLSCLPRSENFRIRGLATQTDSILCLFEFLCDETTLTLFGLPQRKSLGLAITSNYLILLQHHLIFLGFFVIASL
jgi:hypothetical protein